MIDGNEVKGVAVFFVTTEYRTPVRAWAYRPDTTPKKQGQVLQSALTQNSRLLVVAGDVKQASGGMPVWVYACVLGRHSTGNHAYNETRQRTRRRSSQSPRFGGLLRPKATPLKRSSNRPLTPPFSAHACERSPVVGLAVWSCIHADETRTLRQTACGVVGGLFVTAFCCWGSR